MILNGILGKGSGKLGEGVFAVNSGVQIMRQYNSKVRNPKTEAQTAQRAKFKLMSQLAAAMASTIAIPRDKMVSTRNTFIKKNLSLASVSTEGGETKSSVELANIQLTNSNKNLAGVYVEASNEGRHSIHLTGNESNNVNRVVYVIYDVDSDKEELNLILRETKVVEEAGDNGTFPTTTADNGVDFVVYAYGIVDKDQEATLKFLNYAVEGGDDVASLVATRTITTSQYVFTRTSGFYHVS